MVNYNDYTIKIKEYLYCVLNVHCYVEYNVPKNVAFPYATFNLPFSNSFASDALNVIIRSNDNLLTSCVKLVDKLGADIGEGKRLKVGENGYIVLRKGTPFAQYINEETDDNINSFYVNLEVEFY